MLKLVGYIDAGSGSYLLAAIASGGAGVWFFIRSKWAKLRGRGPKPETTVEVTAQEVVAGDDSSS